MLSITTFPQIAIAAPLFRLWSDIGLYNTLIGLVIPYLTFALPLSIYILVSFFREIPKDLEEAALVDGATHFEAFRKVVVPLAAPGLATTAILTFIAAWNEFLLATTLTTSRDGADGAGGDLAVHRVLAVRGPARDAVRGLGRHLDPADPARALVPEANRRRAHRRRGEGVMRHGGDPLQKVWKRYPDGFEAVKDMDLDIGDGEFMILVGPSGCGKSTALRMIAGLEDISDGDLRDRRRAGQRPRRRATATSRWCSRTTRCTRT